MHHHPLHSRQEGGAKSDEEAGNDGARQHQKHRGNDIDGMAPVGCQIPVAGRGHGRDDKIDGVEPATFEDRVEVPSAQEQHRERRHCEANEEKLVPPDR